MPDRSGTQICSRGCSRRRLPNSCPGKQALCLCWNPFHRPYSPAMLHPISTTRQLNTPGLTWQCAAQEQAREIKVLQETAAREMDAGGQLRRDLEAERSRAKVLGLASMCRRPPCWPF